MESETAKLEHNVGDVSYKNDGDWLTKHDAKVIEDTINECIRTVKSDCMIDSRTALVVSKILKRVKDKMIWK